MTDFSNIWSIKEVEDILSQKNISEEESKAGTDRLQHLQSYIDKEPEVFTRCIESKKESTCKKFVEVYSNFPVFAEQVKMVEDIIKESQLSLSDKDKEAQREKKVKRLKEAIASRGKRSAAFGVKRAIMERRGSKFVNKVDVKTAIKLRTKFSK